LIQSAPFPDHARTGNDALIDCLLQADVRVAGPFGPEIADRRESSLERRTQVIRSACDSDAEQFVRDLIVPGRLVVRMQQDVRVRVDEARHERRAGQVDRLGPGGRRHIRRRPSGFDPSAADDNGPSIAHRLAVEHARRLEHVRRRALRAAGATGPPTSLRARGRIGPTHEQSAQRPRSQQQRAHHGREYTAAIATSSSAS
jgi:hypothetical protein